MSIQEKTNQLVAKFQDSPFETAQQYLKLLKNGKFKWNKLSSEQKIATTVFAPELITLLEKDKGLKNARFIKNSTDFTININNVDTHFIPLDRDIMELIKESDNESDNESDTESDNDTDTEDSEDSD